MGGRLCVVRAAIRAKQNLTKRVAQKNKLLSYIYTKNVYQTKQIVPGGDAAWREASMRILKI
jgi:hypothetical protein